MYSSKASRELKHEEMDEAQLRLVLEDARLGFNQFLRRKGFSKPFIDRHGDDLLGTAALEYSRKLSEGEEIENPTGWLITCAWRRTMSQLEAEARRPQVDPMDTGGDVEGPTSGDPEDLVLDEDRFRKVREAVDKLSVNQQKILALSYFEGLTVREAGRALRWHSSKAQRAHEGARQKLHDLLGVTSSDDLVIEVGLAAYISVAGGAAAGNLLERTSRRSAEGLASLKEQVAEGTAHLKQQATATYYRAVDPTPLAAARPGTVGAVIASCIAIGGGATAYCVEQGANPVGAATSLFAEADEPETSATEPEPEPSGPSYTPEAPPDEETPVAEASPQPSESNSPPEPEPKPKPEPKPEPTPPPAPEESFEPTATASSESVPEETYEASEPAPVQTSGPAPAPATASSGSEFEGP